MKLLLLLFAGISLHLPMRTSPPKPKITLLVDEAHAKVEVRIDDQLFTAYTYAAPLKKAVLWPVITQAGNEITRQYPFKVKAGERLDHPHHVGIWFNYGDVNGLDFWNHSEQINPAKADQYGTIHHESVVKAKGGKGQGILQTTATWNDQEERTLLHETSTFRFSVRDQVRIIDRTSTLEAMMDSVVFHDNKEGMFAIRLTRELELPDTKPATLSDANGKGVKQASADNSGVTGDYLSSEGITGGEVWGTRAKWMKLAGEINGEKVAVVIFDHPQNVGYPTYWHARGYGLFACNTLGQKIFSKGKEVLNFRLDRGATATFRYRLALFSGEPTLAEIEALSQEYASDR